ncbi:FAD binding domain-containing protein [Xanthobacter sp. KR7-225]|uniref:FAD binding domain-containing protein n=1 Tax=Xanthobacter sp. KR7-225 TaxID=3156613 RepID=UPI0032B55D90
MKPAPFAYHAPATKAEALGLLARLDDARVLAGGQSLLPMMNLRLAGPTNLIDLNGIAELSGIRRAGDALVIEAMTRQRAAERSELVREHCPLLAEAMAHVGFQQTRNRGTVGGSIAHMDPTAELPVVACALDAVLTVESAAGGRQFPIAELAQGYLMTQIAPDEMLVRIALPLWPKGHGFAFEEVTRRGETFSVVCVAALARLDGAGAFARLALAIGGLGAAPVRLQAMEAALVGARADAEAFAAAGAAAGALEADEAPFAPPDFKRHLAGVLTQRALARAAGRARRASS